MLRSCFLLVTLLPWLSCWTVSGFAVSPFFPSSSPSCSFYSPLSRPTKIFIGGRREHNIIAVRASSDDEEDEEFVKVPRRRRRGRFYDKEEEDDAFYENVERNIYGEDGGEEDWDEEDDEDDLDDEDDEDYGMVSNVLIDNPILDRIDPDGAAERFPELARDPRFWFDMVLFIALLNWLSAVGPQDYFPDIPYYV